MDNRHSTESQPLHDSQAPVAASRSGSRRNRGDVGTGVWQQTLQSRVAVLGTLFLVTGALGLPLLWYSSVFSRVEKGLWSLVAMCYTVALLGVTWAVIAWCYQSVIGVIW